MASTEMTAVKDAMLAARLGAAGTPVPTIQESRAALEARFGGLPPVAGASCVPADVGGPSAEWTIPDSSGTAGTLLYLHGGA